jgi:subtilase family serine protease
MYALNIDPLNPGGNPAPAELRELGVEAVRYTFKDSSSGNQPDAGRVQFYKGRLQAYSEVGITSMVILSYETYPGSPGAGGSAQQWGRYLERYLQRVAQLAQALVPFKPELQIWNEPDLPPLPGYEPSVPQVVYAQMLRQSYNRIKTVSPELRVIGGGLASGLPSWLEMVMQNLGDGPFPADAVAVHPYEQRPEPDWPGPGWGYGYLGDLISAYDQVAPVPLVITEAGDSRLTPEGQAQYLRRFYNAVTSQFSNEVESVYWFCYSDAMVPPFGLLNQAGQRKPAWFAFQELTPPPPIQKADVIVSAVGFDRETLTAGEPVTFQATVRNIGGAVTGDTVGVAFLVDGQYITYGITGPMAAGSSQIIRAVSPWRPQAGSYTLTALVDDINRFPEISEENNSLEITFSVTPPAPPQQADVIVKDIAFERLVDGQVRLAALVENQGGAVTGDAVGVAFFVDGRYITYGIIDPLKAGERKAVRAVRPLPLTGVHQIIALADDINRFPEANEQNNQLTRQIDFGGAPPPPRQADTIVEAVSAGQGRLTAGDRLTFEAVVKNVGSVATDDVVGVAFLVDGQYITYGITSPLPPGETRLVRAVTTWPATVGQHRLMAVVDDINRYPEISEENNRREIIFQVFSSSQPDLPDSVVEQVEFERNPGGQVVLKAVVANRGTAPTGDVVGVAFFVDGRYVSFGIVDAMAPGSRTTVAANSALPLSGRHTITAIVDDINRYRELDDQNNTLVREITF